MKPNVRLKSSITLPREEIALVEELRAHLGAKTKVEVVRRGLRLLKESVDPVSLRKAYRAAARAVAGHAVDEVRDLDGLVDDGLGET